MPLLALLLVKQLSASVASGRLGVENCKHFMRGPWQGLRLFRRNLAYWRIGPPLAFMPANATTLVSCGYVNKVLSPFSRPAPLFLRKPVNSKSR
jgi:hypothetical protein